jgi:hypothetical protein
MGLQMPYFKKGVPMRLLVLLAYLLAFNGCALLTSPGYTRALQNYNCRKGYSKDCCCHYYAEGCGYDDYGHDH